MSNLLSVRTPSAAHLYVSVVVVCVVVVLCLCESWTHNVSPSLDRARNIFVGYE